MKAIVYISALLAFGFNSYAQEAERPDTQPPAVTVADVEQDAKEATHERIIYEADKETDKNKAVVTNANTVKPKQDTDTSKSTYTSTRKSSKKPEKQ